MLYYYLNNDLDNINGNLGIRYNSDNDTLEVFVDNEWVGVLNCNIHEPISLIPIMNSTSQYKQNIIAMNTYNSITDTNSQAPYSSFDGVLTSSYSSWGTACGDDVNTCALGYKFDNETRVQKTIFYIYSGKAGIGIDATLQYSDNNSTWLAAGTINLQTALKAVTKYTIDSTETKYHRYWRILLSSDVYLGINSIYSTHITELQFWGRNGV